MNAARREDCQRHSPIRRILGIVDMRCLRVSLLFYFFFSKCNFIFPKLGVNSTTSSLRCHIRSSWQLWIWWITSDHTSQNFHMERLIIKNRSHSRKVLSIFKIIYECFHNNLPLFYYDKTFQVELRSLKICWYWNYFIFSKILNKAQFLIYKNTEEEIKDKWEFL